MTQTMTPKDNHEYRVQKRKDRIKDIAIAFLAILLVLTFFSRTFMNATLPEVATQAVQAGPISPKLRGTGTVEAEDPYHVVVKETRKIASLGVKVGDRVEKGATLYYLEDKVSQELLDAEELLTSMETQYEKDLFSGTISDAVISRLRAGGQDTPDGYQARLRALQNEYKAAEQAAKDVAIASRGIDLQKQILTSNQAWTDAERAYDSLTPGYSIADATRDLLDPRVDEERKAQLRDQIQNWEEDVAQWNNETAQVDQHFAAQQAGLDYQKALWDYQQDIFGYRLSDAEKEKNEKLAELQLEIDLVSQQERIALQREKVEEYKARAVGATIDAPVSGTVAQLTYAAGENTEADKTAAVIQVEGKPLTTHFSVTTEQAKALKVGDTAEPQNAWYYTDFRASLTAIRPDTADPAGHRELVFRIESPEVQVGQSVSLQIGESAKQYDLTVPNTALREDNNGKFVLMLESKSSPLGNRYKARRVDVQVLASDDRFSAVSGNLDSWSYVITTTTAPVKAGDQVRLSNENL